MGRQQEVEAGPFQDQHGTWHNPDGSFMDEDEAKEMDRLAPQRTTQVAAIPVKRGPGRPPKAAGQQARPRAKARPVNRTQTSLDDLLDDLNGVQEQALQCANRTKKIVEEIGQHLDPIRQLVEAFGKRRNDDRLVPAGRTDEAPEEDETED